MKKIPKTKSQIPNKFQIPKSQNSRNWKLVIGIYLYLGICLLVILPVGCAKTVTPLPVVGNQLRVEMNFKGKVDVSKYSYYLIFGNSSPLAPYPGTYYFGPGETYDINKMNVSTDLNYYYQNYFSTWNDYISLKNNNLLITNGAFASFESHTKYVPNLLALYSVDSANPNKIGFTFFFNRLSLLPAVLYFNIVSVDENGYIRDYLRSQDNKISVTEGSRVYSQEPSDGLANESLDITYWNMVVQ